MVRQLKSSVQALFARYTSFVRKHLGKNYPKDAANTNSRTTSVLLAQDHVLGNENIRRRLITLLCDEFQWKGVLEVAAAEEYADQSRSGSS